ncbi:MAG: hypothetical protein OSJ62_11915 [Lachnospiraceae bacterium]|nr:hypothetical protein [Lachnospiraceae bacterium]
MSRSNDRRKGLMGGRRLSRNKKKMAGNSERAEVFVISVLGTAPPSSAFVWIKKTDAQVKREPCLSDKSFCCAERY